MDGGAPVRCIGGCGCAGVVSSASESVDVAWSKMWWSGIVSIRHGAGCFGIGTGECAAALAGIGATAGAAGSGWSASVPTVGTETRSAITVDAPSGNHVGGGRVCVDIGARPAADQHQDARPRGWSKSSGLGSRAVRVQVLGFRQLLIDPRFLGRNGR